MTGLFTGSSARKGRKRERRADAEMRARGSEPYTGIKPPKAATGTPSKLKSMVLGGIKTPLSS
jgi:hypothetical protein